MATIQHEITLKARDEATKVIQTAFKQADQSIKQFDDNTKRAGSTLKQTSKEVQGFAGYMKEGRLENRQFGFVMREIMDVVAGAALMVKLFGGNSSESEKKTKALSESVMAGYIAFQAAETMLGLASVGLRAFKTQTVATTAALAGQAAGQIAVNVATKANPYIMVLQLLAGAGTAIYAYTKAMEESIPPTEKQLDLFERINKRLSDVNSNYNNLAMIQKSKTAADKIEIDAKIEQTKKWIAADKEIVDSAETVAKGERQKISARIKYNEKQLEKYESNRRAIIKTANMQEVVDNVTSNKKNIEIEKSKNEAMLFLIAGFEKKANEISQTIGLDGVALKRAQLILEEEDLKVQIEKQFISTEKGIKKRQDAYDKLHLYIKEKERQITFDSITEIEKRATLEAGKILEVVGRQMDADNALKAARNVNFQTMADQASQASNLIIGFSNQETDARIQGLNSQLEAIRSRYEIEILAAEGNETLQNDLLKRKADAEEVLNAQIRAEKQKAWKAQQKAALVQVVIDGAMAVSKVLAQTGALAPLVLPSIVALSAAQFALVASQKMPTFHTGGTVTESGGKKEFPILVKSGETVRTEQQEANLRGGVTINFNSPVSDVKFVTNSIKKIMRDSGLGIDKVFVNNRNKLSLN